MLGSHQRVLAAVSGVMLCVAAPMRARAAEPAAEVNGPAAQHETAAGADEPPAQDEGESEPEEGDPPVQDATEDDDPFFEDEAEAAPVVGDPPVQDEAVPVPRVPADPARSGRGMLAAGGALLGLGAVGRMALGWFWAGPAHLKPSEPFGEWSVPNIAFFTVFSNVLVVPGLVLTGFGSRRYGTWRVASGAWPEDPARTARRRKLGLGLLGGGLSLFVVSRAVALPVLRACETNGCAYGFVESTFWLSLGLTTTGAVLSGLAAGERRAASRLAVTPMLGPAGRGLVVGGRF